MNGPEEFLLRLRKRGRDTSLYDYSRVAFRSNKDKVEIVCPTHGSFFQEVKSHVNLGTKCPRCSFNYERTLVDRKNAFLRKAAEIHGGKFDYSLVDYKGAHTNVAIVCTNHGVFYQKPSNHLGRKSECPKCHSDGMHITTEEFIQRCRLRHGDFYDYSLVELKSTMQKILIQCPIHGEFRQRAEGHAYGRGCPKCVKRVSKPEQDWLDSLGVPERQVQIVLTGKKRAVHVDGYNKETKTIYQFHGDYWHGNPCVYEDSFVNKTLKKSMGELFENTLRNDKNIVASGYGLVVKWETNYIEYGMKF